MKSIPTSTILYLFSTLPKGFRSSSTIASLAAVSEADEATNQDVVERLGLSRETVSKSLSSLVKAGVLSVKRVASGSKGGQRKVYRIKP